MITKTETRSLMNAEQFEVQAPRNRRSELVRGEMVVMAPAGGRHGAIAARIARFLDHFVSAKGLGVVCGAETGCILSREPDTIRAPEVLFVSLGRLPEEGVPTSFWPFAPDLAVEVVSPSDSWSAIQAKVDEYLEAGTLLVWVADPDTLTVRAFRPGSVRLYRSEEVLDGGDLLPEFTVEVAELFRLP